MRAERFPKYRALSLASVRSMIDGRLPACFQVCSLVGLRVSSPLESIHSWKAGAHEEAVECGNDHLGECELKSPKNRVGMVSSRVCEKIWASAWPERGLSWYTFTRHKSIVLWLVGERISITIELGVSRVDGGIWLTIWVWSIV